MFERDSMTRSAFRNAAAGLGRRMGALASDRGGNFALTFALISVPLLIAVGCSFDYVRALNTHRKMQSDLDAALVAAVNKVGTKDETALKTEISNWLEAEAEIKGLYVLNVDGVAINATDSTIKASVSATVPTTLMRIAGIESVPVSVSSSVAGGKTITKTAFSMYLVLDHSTSMKEVASSTPTTTCYTNKTGTQTCTKVSTKMDALKLSVNMLMAQLYLSDPQLKYVRSAAVGYDDKMDTNPALLAWGEDHVITYIGNMKPSGLTDSSKAIDSAYQALASTEAGKDENKIHQAKNGVADPKKYIVFMTDGENTKYDSKGNIVDNPAADTSTKATCDAARKNGVTVYSIAFKAPDRGQALLRYCATTANDYFEAQNAADLANAFKSIGESSTNNKVHLTQ